MTFLQAIILGVVQGATEFLPISSSGHIVLVPWWFGWDFPVDLTFIVAMHIGTLLAVLVYFWQDWLLISKGAFKILQTRSFDDSASRLFGWLVIGTIPVAFFGFLLADVLNRIFYTPILAAFFLLVTAGLLLLSEYLSTRITATHTLDTMKTIDVLVVGIAQLLALLPGVSRSGSTIAAGLSRGLSRPDAARFSFLLGTPTILGAGILTLNKLLETGEVSNQPTIILAGTISAAIVGYFSIAVLLNYLRRHRLHIFATYCAVFGLISLLAILLDT
ncbi:undecaprenyl-diphosphatase UppP [Chloroflexota bacterium]